ARAAHGLPRQRALRGVAMNPRARALALTSFSALTLALGASACGARPQAATTPPPNPPPSTGPASNEYPSPRDEERRPDGFSATRREVPVLELRNENSPLVTVRVLFESGSADDPTGKEGLTRLLARAMVEGGTEALTYEQLTRRLFPMAAELSF